MQPGMYQTPTGAMETYYGPGAFQNSPGADQAVTSGSWTYTGPIPAYTGPTTFTNPAAGSTGGGVDWGAVYSAFPGYAPIGYANTQPGSAPGGAGFNYSDWLNSLYGGFGPGGQPTLAMLQFQEQQSQFNQSFAFSQQQFAAQLQQLAQTNQLNQATLAEAVAARQQRDQQFAAQMAQTQSQFEQSFSLEQQRMGLTAQQIAAQIEQIRSQTMIAQQQLGLDAQRIAAQIEQIRSQTELGRSTLAEQQRAAQVAESLRERGFVEGTRQFDLAFAEQMRAAQAAEGFQEAGVTGFYGGAPTLAREAQQFGQNMQTAEVAANPRSLIQGLIMLGWSPQEAMDKVNGSPYVSGLTGGAAGGYPPPPATLAQQIQGGGNQLTPAPGGGQSNLFTGFTTWNQQGRNAAFPFIGGHQAPVRQILDARASGSPLIPLYEGLASASGQEPNAFWGAFDQALPQGAPTAPASFF